MADIRLDYRLFSSDFVQSPQPVAFIRRANWLHELEQAQWRNKPQTHNEQKGAAGGEKGFVSSKPGGFPKSREMRDNLSKHGKGTEGQGKLRPRTDLITENTSQKDTKFAASITRTVNIYTNEITNYEVSGRRFVSEVLRRLFLFKTQKWQKRHMHVSLTQAGVSVWVRDADLELSEGMKILYQLASDFALSGLALAELTINGTKITDR